MSGIYVASRASVPERPAMWRRLRDQEGWPIISTWIDEAEAGQTENFSELWARIHSEIKASLGVILYAEAEDFPLKGAFIECGIALGMGKPVAVVIPGVNLYGGVYGDPNEQWRPFRAIGSWISHPRVMPCVSLESARKWVEFES